MLKAQVFTLCLTLFLGTLVHAIPLESKDAWKSLENPRNRELVDTNAGETQRVSELLQFFRTLQAYFSGRGLDVGKFSTFFRMDNKRPSAAAAAAPRYPNHITSAFSDYEGQKDSFAAFLKG